jgi:Flp pilus assembly protein TadD
MEIDKAIRLSGRGLHDAAWEVLKRAEQVAQNEDLASAHLFWGLATQADERHDAENAVRYIVKALQLDPAAPPFIDSHRIIRERLIASFKEMDATDAAIPTVFRLIADLGAVDASVLVKHSQHLAAEGDEQEALAVAQQALELEPVTSEALRHVARLLAGVGRHEEARARRREAEALVITFPCPKAEA